MAFSQTTKTKIPWRPFPIVFFQIEEPEAQRAAYKWSQSQMAFDLKAFSRSGSCFPHLSPASVVLSPENLRIIWRMVKFFFLAYSMHEFIISAFPHQEGEKSRLLHKKMLCHFSQESVCRHQYIFFFILSTLTRKVLNEVSGVNFTSILTSRVS